MEGFRDRYAHVIRQARADAGLSQIEVSDMIGVSRSTIQKWEDGSATPSLEKFLDYLEKIQRPSIPYMLYLCDPDHYENATIDSARTTLQELISNIDDETIKKLFFCAFANHGSDAFAVLDMVVADLQTPLRARINVAHEVMVNYEIARRHGDTSRGSNTYPDIENLGKAISSGVEAVISHKDSYRAISV